MLTIKKDCFSLEQIAESGQCFRFHKLENERFHVVSGNHYLELAQKGNCITFYCSQEEYHAVWEDYFDMKTDYQEYIRLIPQMDLYLNGAVHFGKGIRILRQNVFETLISFIISQQNNIKRIKKCVELLCTRFGEKLQNQNGDEYYGFPLPEALADAEIEELTACNLGYRARYVRDTARMICGGMDLEALHRMGYGRAKEELMKLPGVGKKVADCVCLFGLHQLDAFPEDTHIIKVLSSRYPEGFPFERYCGCAGVIQQYIFYFDLKASSLEHV